MKDKHFGGSASEFFVSCPNFRFVEGEVGLLVPFLNVNCLHPGVSRGTYKQQLILSLSKLLKFIRELISCLFFFLLNVKEIQGDQAQMRSFVHNNPIFSVQEPQLLLF